MGVKRLLTGILVLALASLTWGQDAPARHVDPTAEHPAFVSIPVSMDSEIHPFAVSDTEITVEQFDTFVKATGYRTKAEGDGATRTWRTPGYAREPGQPVTYVTPLDASEYCSWAGGRLPTDEEWVLAARAGATTRHFWGEEVDSDYLWFRPNSEDRPRAVGTKRPNAFGLYDVEGNVWEWTLANEPVTEKSQASRRGGSWVSCAYIAGAPGTKDSPLIGIDIRYSVPVRLHHRYDDIGFRCVRPMSSAAR